MALETVQHVKDKPRKATLYFTGVAIMTALAKTNPSEKDFRDVVMEMEKELMCLSDLVRNPEVNGFIQTILNCRVHDTLHVTNLGLLSIAWRSEFSPSCDVFVAQCNRVKPRWRDFHKQVLDIGICNRWIYLERMWKDFDINPEEWEDKKEGEEAVVSR